MADFRYPKNWKEMSFDMRLMFGYHICMMVMMVAGGSLTVRQELTIAATIAGVILLVSELLLYFGYRAFLRPENSPQRRPRFALLLLLALIAATGIGLNLLRQRFEYGERPLDQAFHRPRSPGSAPGLRDRADSASARNGGKAFPHRCPRLFQRGMDRGET